MNKKWMASGLMLVTALSATAYFASSTIATPVAEQKNPHQINSIVPIQDKMLNAVDNYKDLQGSYHVLNTVNNTDMTIDFSVQEGANPGSNVTLKNNKDGRVIENRADGSQVLFYDHTKKEYEIGGYDKANAQNFDRNRMYTDVNGDAHYVYRRDPAFADAAADVTLPQAFAFWMSAAPYKITGHETLLGRDTTVIEGQMDNFLQQKLHAANYKFWVDTQTGVLLKRVETTLAGDPVETAEVTSIQFDSGKTDAAKFATFKPLDAKDVGPKRDKTN